MLSVFFFSLITNFIYYCAGYSIQSYNIKNNEADSVIKSLIIGAILLSLAALLLNFFFPLNKLTNSITYLLIILLYFSTNKFKLNKKAFEVILYTSILTSEFLIYSNINRPDAGLYHLPYVSILNSEKIILGLSNLHFRFGHISIIQYLSALNNNFLFGDIGILIPLASLASFIIIYFHYEIIKFYKSKIEINENYFFCFFTLIYIFFKINRYSEFGNDAIAHLGYFYLISCFLKLNLQKINYFHFNHIFLISIFIFMNKNTMIFSFLLPLIMFLFINDKIQIFKRSLFSLTFFFLLLWILKNSLTTGCLIYPLKETCFDTLWSNQILTNNVSLQSEAWSKGWSNNKLPLSQNEFVENFNWLNTWINTHGKIFLNKVLTYIFISIFFIIFFLGKKNDNFRYDKMKIFISFFVCIIGTFFFLIKFPIYRYGFSFLISLIILTFLISFKDYINGKKIKKVSKYLVIISFLVFSTKQLTRIYFKFDGFEQSKVLPSLYQLGDEKINYEKKFLSDSFFYFIADRECMYANSPCTNIGVKDIAVNKKFNYNIIYTLTKN